MKNLLRLIFVFATFFSVPAMAAGAPDLSGVWWSRQATPALRPADGSAIPLTAMGSAEYAKNKVLIKEIDGKLPGLGDMRRCLPAGVPRIWGSGFPFQIMQPRNQVVIAYERDHMRRFVYVNERLDTDTADPAYVGSSVGHWEGDTLVIESGAYKLKTFLDDSGLPHGERLKVTERFRRIGNGNTLELVATIEDPEMYARPWSVRYTFAAEPNERILEYTCGIGVVQTRFGTEGEIPRLRHHGS